MGPGMSRSSIGYINLHNRNVIRRHFCDFAQQSAFDSKCQTCPCPFKWLVAYPVIMFYLSIQINPEIHPEQKWSKMVDPGKKCPAESSLFFHLSGAFLFKWDEFRIIFQLKTVDTASIWIKYDRSGRKSAEYSRPYEYLSCSQVTNREIFFRSQSTYELSIFYLQGLENIWGETRISNKNKKMCTFFLHWRRYY